MPNGGRPTPRVSKASQLGDQPKALIETLSEDLLETFQKARLLDPYDVYQHLMDYWAETMQDDVYLLVQDGWKAVNAGRQAQHRPDPASRSSSPATSPREQAAIEKLEADRDAITRQMEETGRGTRRRGGAAGRSQDRQGQAHQGQRQGPAERDQVRQGCRRRAQVAEAYLALIEKEAAANKKVKDAQKALDAKVAAKYAKLTEDEIKTLVVDDKWLATLAADVQTELDRVSQALTGRIRQLAERYATPLPQLAEEVTTLAARVDEHLKKMGCGMELKPGYKQTEVGVIPEEWDVGCVGDSFDVCNQLRLPISQSVARSHGWSLSILRPNERAGLDQ